ncbi:MAG: tetratricopeptide repeat protein [Candidatus Thorarchaeota archaeon]|nr:tetratricopeptide repeat protein [Candidatus Thorarchaeota archaeon]
MLEPEDDIEMEVPRRRMNYKILGGAALIILVLGITLAWLGGQGIVPLDPSTVLGITILSITIIACCSSMTIIGGVATRIPEYGEMETRFEEGMSHFEAEEWEEALVVFRELMGPLKDHKRALYYAARCCEKRDDFDCVKTYCKRYLELQPRDKEVWELLASAHKRLFEYEEAEDALDKAAGL